MRQLSAIILKINYETRIEDHRQSPQFSALQHRY